MADQHDVTITITGTNDAPSIIYAQTDLVENTVESNVTISSFATGTIGFSDADLSDELEASHTSAGFRSEDFVASQATIDLINESFEMAASGGGGSSDSLVWVFEIDPRNVVSEGGEVLAVGEKLLIDFPVTVSDGNGGELQTRVTLAMTGTVDGIFLTVAGEYGEIVEGNSARRVAAGSFTISQQGESITELTVVPPWFTPNSRDQQFTISPAFEAAITAGFNSTIGDSGSSVDWTFAISEADLDHMAKHDLTAAFFDIIVDLSGGGREIHTVSILINGTNDLPVIVSDVGAVRGDLVEEGLSPGTDTAEGVLQATDADRGPPPKWSLPAGASPGVMQGIYGSLTLDQAGNWVYQLDNSAEMTEALTPGRLCRIASPPGQRIHSAVLSRQRSFSPLPAPMTSHISTSPPARPILTRRVLTASRNRAGASQRAMLMPMMS